jgi:hypothetical protein
MIASCAATSTISADAGFSCVFRRAGFPESTSFASCTGAGKKLLTVYLRWINAGVVTRELPDG